MLHGSDKPKVRAQFFSEAELQRMEAAAKATHAKADHRLPPTAFHKTRSQHGSLRRTKMFFGARCGHLHSSSSFALCCMYPSTVTMLLSLVWSEPGDGHA